MKYDQITLFPAMRVDILRGIDFALHAVDLISDLFHVVHDRDFSGGGVSGAEFVDATAVDLKEWSFWVKGISPDHLQDQEWPWSAHCNLILFFGGVSTYRVFGHFIPTPFRQFLNSHFTSHGGNSKAILRGFTLPDILIGLRRICNGGVKSKFLLIGTQKSESPSAREN
jgi:hypothetical protein